MIKVSIVIPVYNAEKYIHECIDSLLRQTYPYFEVICVDDGSTDNSLIILKEYQESDSRIRVISQKNQYAGVARNNGMRMATGKYLLFLDSDDFFCEDMLEHLVEKAEMDRTDILVFDAYYYDDKCKKVEESNSLKMHLFGNGVKTAFDISKYIFQFTTGEAWTKFYLKDFVVKNNLLFQEIMKMNDLYFVYMSFTYANRISVLNKKLVYYRKNNSSSLQGVKENSFSIYGGEAICMLGKRLIQEGKLIHFESSFIEMSVMVLVYNLNRINSKEVFVKHCSILKLEVFPKIGLQGKDLNRLFLTAIQNEESLIVYGAGTVASAVTKIMLYLYNYKREKISIVVSKRENNVLEIEGIPVQEISQVEAKMKGYFIVIAVEDRAERKAMELMAMESGFEKRIQVGNREIIEWLSEIPMFYLT